ncbi:MAG: PhzF family phenazine biosynthesis protein [Acidimicrobiia bacterium]
MRIFVVDAFTSRPFAGNPAAVCLVDEERDDEWRRAVAAEMNLSETAFVERRDGGGFDLRWFTPQVEADLCGHATLASAHVLWEVGERSPQLRFHTRSGVLTAERSGEQIVLDFPADPPEPVPGPPGLAGALGRAPRWTGRGRFDLLVEVEDEAAVRRLAPDIAALRAVDVRAVIVTAEADPGGPAHFVSRVFAPNVGIHEDPVTGSAHCTLGCFWAERLGRPELCGYQASARGGFVGVRVVGERVLLSGSAVTVLRGDLT